MRPSLNAVVVHGRVGMEECSLYLFLFLIRDRPSVFLVGEGLFQQFKLDFYSQSEIRAFIFLQP